MEFPTSSMTVHGPTKARTQRRTSLPVWCALPCIFVLVLTQATEARPGSTLKHARALINQRNSEHLPEYIRDVKARLGRGEVTVTDIEVLAVRLVKFNDAKALGIIMDMADSANLADDVALIAGSLLPKLKTNWAERTIDDWQKRQKRRARQDAQRLASEFERKVANAPAFEWDLNRRLSDEEVIRFRKDMWATGFSHEIEELIAQEVKEAKPTVARLLATSKNPTARRMAIEYLGALFPQESLDLLASALADNDLSVRLEAVRQLREIDSEKARQALVTRLRRRETHPKEQLAIAEALASIGTDEAVDAIVAYSSRIQEDDDLLYNRQAVVGLLAKFNRNDVVDHLVDVARRQGLTDALWALGLIGSERAVAFLSGSTRSKDRRARVAVMCGLAAAGDERSIREATRLLDAGALDGLQSWHKTKCLRLLCRAGGPIVVAVIKRLGRVDMPAAAVDACRAELRSRADKTAPELARFLREVPEREWFSPSWAIALEVCCAAQAVDTAMVPMMRRAYDLFERQRFPVIRRYGSLREALARKLEAMDGKPYPFTYVAVDHQ